MNGSRKVLKVEEAVIEAFAAIDAVPEEEQITRATLGEFAENAISGASGFYWYVNTQRAYESHPKVRGVTTDYDRRNAKTMILRDLEQVLSVSMDVDPDDKQQGSEA